MTTSGRSCGLLAMSSFAKQLPHRPYLFIKLMYGRLPQLLKACQSYIDLLIDCSGPGAPVLLYGAATWPIYPRHLTIFSLNGIWYEEL